MSDEYILTYSIKVGQLWLVSLYM